jgi:hypothetical protein
MGQVGGAVKERPLEHLQEPPAGQPGSAPTLTMKPPDSRQIRPRLAWHLGIVLLLKFALLALLWYLLVMPYRVQIDVPAMERRLTQATPQSHPKEQTYDRSDRR